MRFRLTKTLLSEKISQKSSLIGFASFVILLFLFWANEMNLLPVNKWMVASGHNVFHQHEYWRLFTSTLIHGDLVHLGHNALFFTIFAALLNNYFSWFIFPFVSIAVGALINFLTIRLYPPEVTLVGISGVIFFMASFWMTSYVLIHRSESLIKRLIVVTGLSLIFFFPEVYNHQTSYLAHGFGFLIGLPLAFIYFQLNKKKFQALETWAVEIEADDIIFNEQEDEVMSQSKLCNDAC